MPTAPSTQNYYLGKGVVKFDRLVGGLPSGLRDMGNAPAFSIMPVVETLVHTSSREGVKEEDLEVITMVGATVKFTLDEYDIENLAIAFLGTVSGDLIHALTDTVLIGELRFLGSNVVGPNYNAICWKVKLKATSEVGFITEDWGKIEFEGKILSDRVNHPNSPFFDIETLVAS